LPADQNGVLVVLEDVHWADASTRELLDYIARRLAGMRLMILGTYRTDELHRKHPLAPMIQGWRRTRAAQIVELQPLPPDGVAGMIRDIFDNNEVTPEFRDFLYRRSEGNPFVIEELLKAALDRGDIYRGATKWERKSLDDLRLPQTVKDTILLRVERLSPEQGEILQIASILGASCSYRALVSLSGRDEQTVQAALHASIQQQLMEEDPHTAGNYRFRHALTREAIYEDMIAPLREQLHSRAADMIAEQSGAAPMDVAYHLFAANRWADASPVAMKAAEDAERSQAFREAATLYERLLTHAHDGVNRGRLLCKLGNAHYQMADPARAQRFLEEGVPLLETGGQPREAARYRMLLGRCYWERSRPADARIEYERARGVLEVEGPSEDLANAYIRLASLHFFEFEVEECRDMALRAVEVASAAGADSARIWAGVFLGGAMVPLGQLDEGFAIMDRSHEEAAARGFHWIARNALYNGIIERCLVLRAKEALPRLELFKELEVGGRPTALDLFARGSIALCLGYPEKARPYFEEALVLAREGESSTFEAWIRRNLAETISALGKVREGLAMLPAREGQQELQDLIQYERLQIRLNLDAGEVAAAVAEAVAVLARKEWGWSGEAKQLYDAAVEALLLGGRRSEAEGLAARTRDAVTGFPDPYQHRLEGRLAMAGGDAARASEHFKAAVDIFAAAEYRLEEMRSRRALAEAQLALRNRGGAEAELRRVLELADERKAAFQGDQARSQLAGMGIEVLQTATAPSTPPGEITERLVTVLFVDIRGYTTMSAREAPDRVVDTVASLHRWARQEIERHYGLVDKYEGDAVMATFNVTTPRLDHALHALQAAIAIRDKATAAGMPVGAGIAVGPAVVGQLTSDGHVSTYGEVTNLASRLQGKAAAGEILLSEEAHRRVRDWLTNHGLPAPEESLTLKGLEQPVRAFRIQMAVQTPPGPHRGA
ncbi:MAG TPA: adenylate/guanylate cyclase domain-containing protein, partial [Candidatus Dormibacteraeota bacterium]|nr:adenylate/guanylate cyclase domain-containing protein [Candidatus Dormibacteraeota bacterium]